MLLVDSTLSCPNVFDGDSFLPMVPVLESTDSSNVVLIDGFRIGSSRRCDLQLDEGPRLHSVIHYESGVLWIEADDESARLLVNGSPCRRMALRDGDLLTLGHQNFTVRLLPSGLGEISAEDVAEDITQLSAEELCDRILCEQADVDEFETGRKRGWENLLAAIQSGGEEEEQPPRIVSPVEVDEPDPAEDCERLLEQIRELSEIVSGRTQELDSCENDLAAAATLLQETQERVSQQISELLDQIHDVPEVKSLRASA